MGLFILNFIINNKFNAMMLLIPILLFLVHFSYGVGTLVGLVKGFSWKKEYYKAYQKAGVWGKIWILFKQQIGI